FPSRSTYAIPLFVGLVRSAALRSPKGGAFRRPRCDGPLGHSLLHRSASRLSPRVIRWRHPLPFGRRRNWLIGPFDLHTGLAGCRNLLPPQRAAAILDGDVAVPPFAHQHFPLSWRVMATLRLELKKPVVVAHHQSSLIVRSLSSRKTRSSSAARGARR